MKNSIIQIIATKIETFVLSLDPQPKRKYAPVYVRSNVRELGKLSK